MQQKPKILVIMTGGTICSFENADGKRYSNAKDVKIIDSFHKGQGTYANKVDFDTAAPLDILSENMTPLSWNKLLCEFRKTDFSLYKGVIILHGTDTLAYTSAMLSVSLGGFCVPVMMVSAQLPLGDKDTNGHDNFRAAVELILNGIKPNVYAVYKNSDGNMYVHYGAFLEQCKNFSDDFFSANMTLIGDTQNTHFEGRTFENSTDLLLCMNPFSDDVILISPYTGLNYDRISLDNAKAVVHKTFHSESVCVDDKTPSPYSVLSLIDRCKEKNIPVFLAPCSEGAYKYESTGVALKGGAYYIENTTIETAYAKVMVGTSLGLKGDELVRFVNTPINWENNR